MDPLVHVQQRLRYSFARRQVLEVALRHSSAASDGQGRGQLLEHNQRLALLRDAILDPAVALRLAEEDHNATKGVISQKRAGMVSDIELAKIAHEVGLHLALTHGGSVARGSAETNTTIMAEALEAIIGAIFVDSGFEIARRVVEGLYDRFGPAVAMPN